MTHPVWLSIQQAVDLFGISRSTLERRLRKGDIHQSQTRRQGSERQISFVDLLRVFGEPKNRPGETVDAKAADQPQDRTRIDGTTAQLVELLKADLERERARADKESARADQERARAERYESDLSEARRRNDELTQRLLPPPRAPGLLARLLRL
jgi:hypothetical protein